MAYLFIAALFVAVCGYLLGSNMTAIRIAGKKSVDIRECGCGNGDLPPACFFVLEMGAHLVQCHMPCGGFPQPPFQIQFVCSCDRRGQMPQLQAFVFVMAFIVFTVINKTIGLRVTKEEEIDGLDVHEHGSSAYADFNFRI